MSNVSGRQFLVIVSLDNCSVYQSQLSTVQNIVDVVLSSVQFICHLLSFLLAMIAFFVVKYYTIAGRRMNYMLLLLAAMEIQYNAMSVLHHLTNWAPSASVHTNIYLRIVFALLSNHYSILTRNWWTVLIALARYLVVSKPLGRCHISIVSSNVYFGLIIITGFTYVLVFTAWFRIYAITCTNSTFFQVHIWDLHGSSVSFRIADSLTVGIKSLVPLFLVIIFSLLTYYTVKKPNIFKDSKTRKSLRTSRTLLLICLLFTLCQLPYAMTIVFCFLEKDSILYLYMVTKRVALILVAINSLGNVAIYFIRSHDFRLALIDMRHCKCNFVKLRKDKQRKRILSSWNSYSQSKQHEESSDQVEENL